MRVDYRSGLVTLIGRPNVGKSTLLNRLMGRKISITSQRPQTTRHRILGIKTTGDSQVVYVDTPGLQAKARKQINRYMSRVAQASIEGVDCVVFVITVEGWQPEDDSVLKLLRGRGIPIILAINRIDKLKDRGRLLPLIKESAEKMAFAEIIPVSARTGENLVDLEKTVIKYLPVQPAIYPEDQLTDRSERFLVAELIREQIFRGFGEEVPYATAIEITEFKRLKGIVHIEGTIWVEKEGQKAILIGKEGVRLKTVGQRARLAMQKLLGDRVHLKLWVRARKDWSDNVRMLRTLGYSGDD